MRTSLYLNQLNFASHRAEAKKKGMGQKMGEGIVSSVDHQKRQFKSSRMKKKSKNDQVCLLRSFFESKQNRCDMKDSVNYSQNQSHIPCKYSVILFSNIIQLSYVCNFHVCILCYLFFVSRYTYIYIFAYNCEKCIYGCIPEMVRRNRKPQEMR